MKDTNNLTTSFLDSVITTVNIEWMNDEAVNYMPTRGHTTKDEDHSMKTTGKA